MISSSVCKGQSLAQMYLHLLSAGILVRWVDWTKIRHQHTSKTPQWRQFLSCQSIRALSSKEALSTRHLIKTNDVYTSISTNEEQEQKGKIYIYYLHFIKKEMLYVSQKFLKEMLSEKYLGWPKSSFRVFHNILQKTQSKLFGQPSISWAPSSKYFPNPLGKEQTFGGEEK